MILLYPRIHQQSLKEFLKSIIPQAQGKQEKNDYNKILETSKQTKKLNDLILDLRKVGKVKPSQSMLQNPKKAGELEAPVTTGSESKARS